MIMSLLLWINRIFIFSSAVPETLALMVDLEDDPEWSIQDETDDDDIER